MKFSDVLFNQCERFAVGVEQESGRYYVSIPVANAVVDYDEYYQIERAQFELFQHDLQAALAFVSACRKRQMDDRLMLAPGRLRGSPT